MLQFSTPCCKLSRKGIERSSDSNIQDYRKLPILNKFKSWTKEQRSH